MVDWPIGTPEERTAAINGLPGKWQDYNPYLNRYRYGFHTGADLNLNYPYWNADKDAPVYAIADGEIVFSGIGKGYTWGWIIIQRCAGFWVRYAHVNHDPFTVNGILMNVPKAGETVLRGRQIARVGDADDFYEPGGHHLHFDIARTDILEHDPSHWPGLDWKAVQKHYHDPIKFIIDHKTIQAQPPQPEPEQEATMATVMYVNTNTLNLRSKPAGTIVGKAVRGTKVLALDYKEDKALGTTNYTWQAIKLEDDTLCYTALTHLTTTPPV